jgi:hypothetical protein
MHHCRRYLLILALTLAAGGALAQGFGLGFGTQDVRRSAASAAPVVPSNLQLIGGGNILLIGGGNLQCVGVC